MGAGGRRDTREGEDSEDTLGPGSPADTGDTALSPGLGYILKYCTIVFFYEVSSRIGFE